MFYFVGPDSAVVTHRATMKIANINHIEDRPILTAVIGVLPIKVN